MPDSVATLQKISLYYEENKSGVFSSWAPVEMGLFIAHSGVTSRRLLDKKQLQGTSVSLF